MYPSVLNLLEGAEHTFCHGSSSTDRLEGKKQLTLVGKVMDNDAEQPRAVATEPLSTPPMSRGKEVEDVSSEERRRGEFKRSQRVQRPLFTTSGSPMSLLESPQSAPGAGPHTRPTQLYETLEPGPSLQQGPSSDAAPIAIPRVASSLQPGTLAARRRSFRKRRKDPSCDGCKDRKVKCDATSATSCSECLQRGITCKFTKQGNRKMSAARQVQELEKQLLQSQQQNHLLRSMLKGTGSVMQSSGTPAASTVDAKPPSTPKGRQPLRKPGLVVRHMRSFSDGIFKAPPPYREQRSEHSTDLPPPALPAKAIAERLTNQYRDAFAFYSVVRNWPHFVDSLNSVYEAGSFVGVPRAWVAMLFAILAIGTLQESSSDIAESRATSLTFLQHALEHTRDWNEDDITLEHCAAALLISVFYFESSLRSCSRLWLVTAVSLASEIGLNEEHGPWSPEEAEERRHVWWTIYFWDRIMSVETLNAPLIDENECTINLPRPLHELDNEAQMDMAYITDNFNGAILSVVVPFVRLLAPIRHLNSVPVIVPETLDMFVNSLADLEDRLPDLLQPSSLSHLDAGLLRVTAVFSNARLLLHRHNLSPTASPEARATALNACTAAALTTVHYITRSLEPSTGTLEPFTDPNQMSNPWDAKIRSSAVALVCTHIWRCVLVLSISLNFEAALTCARVGLAMSNVRNINLACARSLVIFLDHLKQRLQVANWQRRAIEADEELLAYASGDLQQNSRTTWVSWEQDEPSLETQQASLGPASDQAKGEWPRVQQILTDLLHERQRVEAKAQQPAPATHQQRGSESSDRISISKIID